MVIIPLSFEDIPQTFADSIGVNLTTGQVMLSFVVIFFVLLPVLILKKGKGGITIELIILFLTECFLVGIGWMPLWVLIATIMILVIGLASFSSDVITGRSG